MAGSSTRTAKWSVRIAAIAATGLLGFGTVTSAFAGPAPKLSYSDLVVGQPQSARVAHVNPSSPPVMFATIVNRTLLAGAAASSASVSLRPVTKIQINGQTEYLNAFNRPAADGSGAVTPLPAGASNSVVLQLSANPDGGLYRVTVCADSTGVVRETNETNNCTSLVTLLDHQYFG